MCYPVIPFRKSWWRCCHLSHLTDEDMAVQRAAWLTVKLKCASIPFPLTLMPDLKLRYPKEQGSNHGRTVAWRACSPSSGHHPSAKEVLPPENSGPKLPEPSSFWFHNTDLCVCVCVCVMATYSICLIKTKEQDFLGGPGSDSLLPIQEAWVQSLVRELDPTCCN